MFDNIAKLRFQDGNAKEKVASAMISSEGEVMDFRQPILAEGRVEDWMTKVLEEMRRTNRLITKEAIFNYCHEITRYVNWNLLLTMKFLPLLIGPFNYFHNDTVFEMRITIRNSLLSGQLTLQLFFVYILL